MYRQTEAEIERLKRGIRAAFATPFADDIEYFVWEAIFSYAKGEAQASAYQAGAQAMGQQGFTAVQLMQIIGCGSSRTSQ